MNRFIQRHMAFLVFALLASGCVVSNATKLTTETYPPVPPDQVAIYLSEDDIPGEYIKIGLINAKGNHGWTDEEQMLNKMRSDAGKLGANGILYASIDEPGTGAKIAGAVLGVGVNRRGQVVAILVENDEMGTIAEMQARQKEARASLPDERTCKSSQEGRSATLYKAVGEEKIVVRKSTGGRSEIIGYVEPGEYVLRVDSFQKYEKVCFRDGYGWINKNDLSAEL